MNRSLIYLGVAVLALAGSFALAQDAPIAETDAIEEIDETERQSNPDIDEITVTGMQSDVTNIQNESQAVSAFSMEELDRANIVSVDNLAFNVPALHVGQTGASSIITLRGIGTENSTITGEPGLQFHVDGVNFPNPSSARVSFFDLEGLQVLRGPQGFTGGKNATAGHIQVITRKPTADFETEFDYQWGNYDKMRVRGAVNVPLNEYVQTRFAFFRDDRTGFQKNLSEFVTRTFEPGVFRTSDKHYAFDADDWGYRGHARFINPAANPGLLPTELLLSYNYYQQDGVGPATELQSLPLHKECTSGGFGSRAVDTNFPNFAVCGGSVATDNGSAARIHEVYKDRLTEQHNEYWNWTATLDWDFDPLPLLGETQLKSITSYQRVEIFQDGDLDGTDIVFFSGLTDNETAVWVQELQWFGSVSELMDWQLSAFYAHDESTSLIKILSTTTAFATLRFNQEVENKSMGLALNTDWYLTDDLTLTLGGRWVRDKKEDFLLRDNSGGSTDRFNLPFQTCIEGVPDILNNVTGEVGPDGRPDPPNDPPPVCEETFRHLMGTAQLQYFATDSSQFYGSISSGFKAGGFAALEIGQFKPEYIWSFEIGNKNSLFDDRLTLNMAAYHYHYRDLQLTVTSGPSTRTDNADAEVQGFELEFDFELLPGLRLNGQGTYTDSEITDYLIDDPVDGRNNFVCNRIRAGIAITTPCIPQDFSGNQLSRAPEFSYTLGVEYDIYLGRYGTLTPRIQYYWQDDTWFRAFNRTPENSGPNCPEIYGRTARQRAAVCGSIVNDLQESYHYTDIKATWRSPGDRFWAEAAVQNLEDDAVYQNVVIGSGVLGNPGFAWYGPPRTYTFLVGFRY